MKTLFIQDLGKIKISFQNIHLWLLHIGYYNIYPCLVLVKIISPCHLPPHTSNKRSNLYNFDPTKTGRPGSIQCPVSQSWEMSEYQGYNLIIWATLTWSVQGVDRHLL